MGSLKNGVCDAIAVIEAVRAAPIYHGKNFYGEADDSNKALAYILIYFGVIVLAVVGIITWNILVQSN